MSGTRLALALAVAFGFGYGVRFLACVYRCSERNIRLYRRLLVAEAKANGDHGLCQEKEHALAGYIAWQEARLDAFEHPEQVAEQAERITREGP